MKVLLFAGGDSNERSVSLDSGKAVYESLTRMGHKVYAIDPSSGRSLLASDGTFIEHKPDSPARTVPIPKSKTWSLANALASPGFTDIDVVFITLHGGSGENGKIQCLLDLANKKYTGSNMAASAIAMDKAGKVITNLAKVSAFDIPLKNDAILGRDYPIVQGGTLLIAVIFVVISLLVDVSYAYLDPRIKYD